MREKETGNKEAWGSPAHGCVLGHNSKHKRLTRSHLGQQRAGDPRGAVTGVTDGSDSLYLLSLLLLSLSLLSVVTIVKHDSCSDGPHLHDRPFSPEAHVGFGHKLGLL